MNEIQTMPERLLAAIWSVACTIALIQGVPAECLREIAKNHGLEAVYPGIS